MSANPGWTDDLVAALKARWASGWSAAQIAVEIGVTRNAALGKLNRLGLLGTLHPQAGQSPRPKPKRTAAPRKPRPAAKPVDEIAGRTASAIIVDDFIVEPLTLPDQRGVKLHELTNSTCRWPLGPALAPAELFCGATQADMLDGRPYCPHHARAARRT
jgi:GcrA cell cycle regulator